MYDGGCIVSRIQTAERIADGFSQVPFPVGPSYTFLDGIVEISAGYMNILTYFQEDNGHARILAEREALFPGDARIFDDTLQGKPAEIGLFGGGGFPDRPEHVFAEIRTRLEKESLHRVPDGPAGYFSKG
jgi:hypothetical protein